MQPLRRVHLGWDQPPLELAARWLATELGAELGGAVVALPGARAGRKLRELLAEAVGPGWRPPRFVTAGALSDELVRLERAPARRLVRTLAWARALAGLEPAVLRRVAARPPERDDLSGWLRLAGEVRGLFGELAAEGVDFAAVAAGEGLSAEAGERARWAALAAAQEAMRSGIEEAGLVDPHLGRLEALERSAGPEEVTRVALVGVVDMNGLTRRALESCGAPIDALIFAPEELAGGFDELGCLRPEFWLGRETSLALECWHVVEDPDAQAARAVELLAQHAGSFAPEQVTLGLADPEVAPYLKRRLGSAGYRTRDAAGTAFDRTGPARLVAAAASYLDQRRFRDLAALVRHPDLEAALELRSPGLEPVGVADEYSARHLPELAEGGPRHGAYERVLALVSELLGGLGEGGRRPLGDWGAPTRAFLEAVYGERALEPQREEDRVLAAALGTLGAGLGELEDVPPTLHPEATAAEALDLLGRSLGDAAIPPPPDRAGEATIELLGWLELALDEAPALVVTGFEEGRVPESTRGDAYLPDRLRRSLGVVDDDRRLARDLYAVELIVHSRAVAHFVTGRRSLAGDPQLPSRVVFHCADGELVPRVRRFLPQGDAPHRLAAQPAAAPRELPRDPRERQPERFPVTAFKLYLESPYAYYLQRVLGLESLDDRARELDPLSFGNLAHDVLQLLGEDAELLESTDAGRIAAALEARLASLARARYGARPMPAVVLQLEQLRYRLARFAEHQAARRAAGWRIAEVEWTPREGHWPLEVDGAAARITGRIDRIERHTDGRWAIWDYKSGDRVPDPRLAHRKSDGTWRDLQLPLYCFMAAELGMEEPPIVGYAGLGRDEASLGFLELERWSSAAKSTETFEEGLESALETAGEVVRRVRDGALFDLGGWKPRDPIWQALGGEGLLENAGAEEELS